MGAPIDLDRYGSYRGHGEVLGASDAVVAAYPDLFRRIEYGQSRNGLPLVAYRLGRRGRPAPVRALYVSAIHAMEWIGVESLLELMKLAAQQMAAGQLPDRSITFVPIVNPDGFVAAEDNLRARKWRFVRRNAADVDLNRNFETHFDSRRRVAPLRFFFNAGSGPFSEPETRALRDLADSEPPQRFVSFHAFGGYFLYPYTGSRRLTPDLELHLEIGRQMRALQPRYPYRLVRIGSLPSLLWARGSEIDYFRDHFGALAFLIEVGKGGLELTAPSRVFEPFCWFNPRDVRSEVENVLPAALHVTAAEL